MASPERRPTPYRRIATPTKPEPPGSPRKVKMTHDIPLALSKANHQAPTPLANAAQAPIFQGRSIYGFALL
jgi:hypothetical protein